MKTQHTLSRKHRQGGVALLIAIFVLLLVSVAAMSMVMASGSEGALAGNYRSSTSSYYAAIGGLEEVRARLSGGDPNSFGAAITLPMLVDDVYYVTNGVNGEVVDPKTSSSKYEDKDYGKKHKKTPKFKPYVNSIWTGAATPGPLYKWVRINPITEESLGIDVNQDKIIDPDTTLFYDAVSGQLNKANTGSQALEITSLATMPDGSQRLLAYIVGASPIPAGVDAAVSTKLDQTWGDALNGTGKTDPACGLADKAGAKSGSTIAVAGGGNVKGSPDLSPNNPPGTWDKQLAGLFRNITPTNPIDTKGTGVTGSGSPAVYSGPHATLGIPPAPVYDGSGAITKITSPGTPAIYLAGSANPTDPTGAVTLNLGVSTIGGAPVSGQGVLLVHGDLVIDITNGFNYFGLIAVTGNITMIANPNTSATSNIHGYIIGGGTFSSNLKNLGGSVFIHQNACLVNSALNTIAPEAVLSFREISQ
jgi:hypothetical protein